MTTKVQIYYSETAGAVPASLLPGELAVNTADKNLWTGDEAGNVVLIAGPDGAATDYVLPPATSAALGGIYANLPVINPDNEFVRGVDESGQLVFGNVVFPSEYVLPPATDAALGGVYANTATAPNEFVKGVQEDGQFVFGLVEIPAVDLSGYLPLSGGQMTGPIVLAADPVEPQEAATKAYADALSEKVNYVLPPATNAALGGVVADQGIDGSFVTGVTENGTLVFAPVVFPDGYILPPASETALGGVFAGLAAPGEVVIGVDDAGALIYGPDQAPQYQLPPATVAALGGVFAGSAPVDTYVTGIDETGKLTFTDMPAAPGEYVLPVALPDTLGGVKATANPGGQFVIGVDVAGALVYGSPDMTGYLPLAGGTMTGTIKVPNGVNALQTASGFNIIGDAAGLTVRSGTTNLLGYGVSAITAFKPVALPADPTTALQAATKQYVDAKVGTPYVLPVATATVLGGVKATANPGGQFVTGVLADGSLAYGAVSTYALPTASDTVLGGVKVGANLSIDASGVLSAPAPGTNYTLPTASATVLGGVKIGNGLSIDASGVVSASLAGNYVSKSGDVMSGPLRFSPSSYSAGYNGTDAYFYMDTAYVRMIVPSGKQAYVIDPQTAVMQFLSAAPQTAFTPTVDNDLVNKKYADNMLPLAGGTMTGTITMPSSKAGFQFGATGYNVFGGSGGVAVRSNTTNIVTFTGANVTNFVPLITPATGVGVQFGVNGATLSRGSAATKIASSGMIELPTTAPAAGEAVRRDYVDGRVIAQAAGGAAPATTGLSAGTLWVEY